MFSPLNWIYLRKNSLQSKHSDISGTSPQRVSSVFMLLCLCGGFQSQQKGFQHLVVPGGSRGLLTTLGHTLTPPGFHLSIQPSMCRLLSRQLAKQKKGMRVPWTMDYNANCSSPNFVLFFSIRNTLENHLVEKGAPVLPGLDKLSEELYLSNAKEVWRLAVNFKRWTCPSKLQHCDA